MLIQRIDEMQGPSTSTHLCSSMGGILCGYYFIGFKRNDKSLRSKIDPEQNVFYTGDCYCMIKIMEIRHKFIFIQKNANICPPRTLLFVPLHFHNLQFNTHLGISINDKIVCNKFVLRYTYRNLMATNK